MTNTGKATIAIVGDQITDVVFPAESRSPVLDGKETFYSVGASIASGPGGVRYTQMLFEMLFHTHHPAIISAVDRSSETVARVEAETQFAANVYKAAENVASNHISHWTVASRPVEMGQIFPSTYRVIERAGRLSTDRGGTGTPTLPLPSEFTNGCPELLVIADYNRDLRTNPQWKDTHQKWLTATSVPREAPRRIILLGNRLPSKVFDGSVSEAMWDVLYREKEYLRSTIVITSIDRLRQEGANISKRLSWDATLSDFCRELKHFPPLQKLSEVGHLIVRIGVVGAFHCYWSERNKQEVRFLYHPDAPHGIFRNRTIQGNAFGIRSAFPACIAFQLWLYQAKLLESPTWYDQGVNGAITMGIKDGIHLIQEVYKRGFGPKSEDVYAFVSEPGERWTKLLACCEAAMKSYTEGESVNKNMVRIAEGKVLVKPGPFTHIVRPPYGNWEPSEGNVSGWSILHDNFRAMIKEEDLRNEWKSAHLMKPRRRFRSCESAINGMRELQELRRLRMARAIAFLGVERAINRRAPSFAAMRGAKEPITVYLGRMLHLERECNRKFCERLEGEVVHQDVMPDIVPEWFGDAFPLNAPITNFGALQVVGNTDAVTYCSIRNLLALHVGRKTTKPLSLVVFGAPGSGKSFGISCIARELGGDTIEICKCNVTQLRNRDDLSREMFNASQIAAKGKIPLIFFDEFDCVYPGDTKKVGWLKYFLEPMEDGTYRHPDGMVELKNAIFVFAGGTAKTFSEFSDFGRKNEDVMGQKLPDFISRIHGHIDVPGLNREENDKYPGIPFIRRALVLRSLIEEEGHLVDGRGIAQVDRNVMDAFLRVDRYKHGARSLKSVFGMCLRWNFRIEKFCVPSKAQLDVHTNGGMFRQLLDNLK